MKVKEIFNSSLTEDALSFKPVDEWGLEGTYTQIFVDSPITAKKFVSYLQSVGAKDISTGRRGKEYLIAWNKVFVDVKEWRKAGMPEAKK